MNSRRFNGSNRESGHPKRELAFFGLMSASTGCGHGGTNAYRRLVPYIVAKVIDGLAKP
jgi:hypothetical protein